VTSGDSDEEVKMGKWGWSVVAAVALLIGGCATVTSVDPREFQSTVEKIYTTYSASVASGDQDLWLSNWDVDGIQMRPDSQPLVGKKAIEERVRRVWPTVAMTMSIKIEETVASGEWGYARGTYAQTMTPRAGGATANVDGKYLTVFRRQTDGTWKIYRDCFNSNVPPK
jgi:uncharacterized protein (TIGR02246 family)